MYMTHQSSYFIQEHRTYSECFPDAFGALCHDDDNVKLRMHGYIKTTWETLETFERRAHNDKKYKTFVAGMVWPSNPWVRKVCIGSRECKGQSLPDPAQAEVDAASTSFHTSQPCELENNWIREEERVHKASKLGRHSCWHKLTVKEAQPTYIVPSVTT